jgi:hypothetical protein
MDCTDSNHRARVRVCGSIIAFAAAIALALGVFCGAFPAAARADGDPASDVLATQALFLPQDAGIPLAQQGQLSALVSAAATSGYPIRVALIASSSDLGSVTELWRQPATYARFLGQELSLIYHGPLLVVMPNGFGINGATGASPAAVQSALAGVRITGAAGLGTAALTAIQHLAAAAGHSLQIPAAAHASGSGSTNPAPIVAFALGAVLIAFAWGASLRARPPRLSGRRATQ